MSRIEEIKAERDGLDVGSEIPTYARDGWESIPEEDRDTRLKWWGVFYRKQTPGHFMMRIRIPNGIATSDQIRAIGEISRTLGRNTVDLTTRQQIQLRWIKIEDIPGILERLREVGLVTLQTGLDNIRGVVGCPVAGLTPNELFDASPVAQQLTDIFVGNKQFTNLPRKMNVTITGCLENCCHAETQDIAFVPARESEEEGAAAGFNVLVGGKMGSGGYRIATPLDVFVKPEAAASLAAKIILMFRDHGSRDARNRARLAFLVEDWGIERFRWELEQRVDRPLARAGVDARGAKSTDHIGVWRQRGDHTSYVGLLVPIGRTSGANLEELARLADVYGSGEVRLTVGQNAIIPDVTDARLQALLAEPLLQKLRYDPSEIARGSVSCTGKDYCSLALIETKGYARDLVTALEKAGTVRRPLTVNWSGCPAGCGNHQVSDIGFVGRRTKVEGKIIDAVDVYVGGASGPDAVPGMKIMENVPCSDLPRLAGFLTQYGDFKQLHSQLLSLSAPAPTPAGVEA